MALTGIDAVVFGVEALDVAQRYLTDWGLTEEGGTGDTLRFLTRDGTEVTVRRSDDCALPTPMQDGPTLREVIWGVDSQEGLEQIAGRIGEDRVIGADDMLRIVDPNGLSHAFRVTQRIAVVADAQDVNGPGLARRIDRRSKIYDRALPIAVGHVVLFVDNLQDALDFFVGRLGFVISDSYPGHAAFLRAKTPGSHHDLFVLQRPGNPGLNHVAFTVSNIHEVFGGGLAMMRKGWETDLGPGRHPISSAYFWYMRSPFGGSLEYYADDDYCTEAWEPGEHERKPELFAEWAISGGIDGHTRRQVRPA